VTWVVERKTKAGGRDDLATSHWKILFHIGRLATAADAQFAAMPYVFFLFLIERLTQP
jgi:hypothetical protein